MIIEVTYEGSKYALSKVGGRSTWIGISRGKSKGSIFPGAYCAVPKAYWGALRGAALKEGIDLTPFEKVEEKKKPRKKKAKKENVISIF